MKIELTTQQQLASEVLRLNKWGQISIVMFCDDAIKHVLKDVDSLLKVRFPYNFFMEACRRYSFQNGLPIDRPKVFELQKLHGMPAGCDVFVDESLPKFEKKKSKAEQPKTQFYTAETAELDYDQECRKWHDMVINWHSIQDIKKKCAKGYELTYPPCLEWLKVQSIEVRQQLADVLPSYRVLMGVPFTLTPMVDKVVEKTKMDRVVSVVQQIDDPNIEYIEEGDMFNEQTHLLFDGGTDPS